MDCEWMSGKFIAKPKSLKGELWYIRFHLLQPRVVDMHRGDNEAAACDPIQLQHVHQ